MSKEFFANTYNAKAAEFRAECERLAAESRDSKDPETAAEWHQMSAREYAGLPILLDRVVAEAAIGIAPRAYAATQDVMEQFYNGYVEFVRDRGESGLVRESFLADISTALSMRQRAWGRTVGSQEDMSDERVIEGAPVKRCRTPEE